MALVIPVGFCEAAMELRNSGDPDPWYVTWGMDVSDAGGDYNAVGAAAIAAWQDSFGPSLRTTTTTMGVRLTIGQDGTDNLIVFVPDGTNGTSTDDKLPQNCALLVSKNSALGGRKNRGRFFIPGILAESSVNDVGVIGSGTVTSFQGFADNMLTDLTAGVGGNPSVPMYILHNDTGPSTIAPTAVSSLSVSATISTQRRRLR